MVVVVLFKLLLGCSSSTKWIQLQVLKYLQATGIYGAVSLRVACKLWGAAAKLVPERPEWSEAAEATGCGTGRSITSNYIIYSLSLITFILWGEELNRTRWLVMVCSWCRWAPCPGICMVAKAAEVNCPISTNLLLIIHNNYAQDEMPSWLKRYSVGQQGMPATISDMEHPVPLNCCSRS